jgi:hypothetical protein
VKNYSQKGPRRRGRLATRFLAPQWVEHSSIMITQRYVQPEADSIADSEAALAAHTQLRASNRGEDDADGDKIGRNEKGPISDRP